MIDITRKISNLQEEFLSSVSECRACYLKVPGSTPDGGIFLFMDNFTSSRYSVFIDLGGVGGSWIVNKFKHGVGKWFVKCKCLHNNGYGKSVNE